MGQLTTAAKVGAFSIVLLVAGVMMYRFIGERTGSAGGHVVYALMRDAAGLAKHSQVRIAGVSTGSIKSIRLVGDLARVDISLAPDIKLYDDATLTKVSSSFLGEYYLSVAPGTEGRPELKDGDRIRNVIDSSSMDDITKDVSRLIKDLIKVSDALAVAIGGDEGKQDLKAILRNLADGTSALNSTIRENQPAIRNIVLSLERVSERVETIVDRNQPEVEQTVQNVRAITQDLRELVSQVQAGGAEDQKGGQQIREIIQKVNRSSSALEQALQNLDTVSARLERGEGTLGRLSKDEKLIDEVEGVAEGVGEFVGGLARLQTIVSLRSDYGLLTNSIKSYVELRLQPREDKYYLVEVVNDPRGFTRYEQIEVDSTNPNDPPHFRQVRTVTSNSFRFSLQFAQRIGPFTGRFGIKESTGGIGLDTSLFDDRLEFRQDLFGFGELVVPRWRVSLGYEFVNRLWLLAGMDDILNGARRDYFFGTQLRFNDHDLKSVLPFAPKP